MENKYNEGEIVFAVENPELELKVRRYVDRIYYCRPNKIQGESEFVYFERELFVKDNNPGTQGK